MARRIRKAQMMSTTAGIELGTASADVILPITAPSAGAIIDRITFTDQIVGVVSTNGSYTLIVEEYGTATALTGTITIGEADAGVGTIVTADGNGAGASAEGKLLQMQVTEVGTVSTTLTVVVSIWWIT